MNDKRCKDCEKCISIFGRTRCGRCKGGYVYIDENDPACDEFEQYECEESES